MAVGADAPQPAQQDIAAGLHQPLALHNSLGGVGVAARAKIALQHRRFGFLDLHQQGIIVIAPQQQYHPRSGADAAHADYLPGPSDKAESADEHATAGIQALPILVDEDAHLLFVPSGLRLADKLVDRNEQWRIAGEPAPPVDNPG